MLRRKLEESFKFQIIICVFLSLIIILCFAFIYKLIDKLNFYKYTIEDDINLINSIEELSIEKDKLLLSGYAFLLNENSNDNIISVFLRNIQDNKEFWMKTDQLYREDVNSYFDCEYDYGNSGFISSINIKKLKKDKIYEIFINIDYNDESTYNKRNRKTVSTHCFIQNGVLYTYNPAEFDVPDMQVESELLKKVFTYGQLCFYRKDAGMYVYKYENNLYWIANSNFKFDKNNLTYIPLHIFTTRVDKLPKERIHLKYDNLHFEFEKYEYNESSTKPYRVAVRQIPNDYPITYIKTGIYDRIKKIWIWSEVFQLDNISKN